MPTSTAADEFGLFFLSKPSSHCRQSNEAEISNKAESISGHLASQLRLFCLFFPVISRKWWHAKDISPAVAKRAAGRRRASVILLKLAPVPAPLQPVNFLLGPKVSTQDTRWGTYFYFWRATHICWQVFLYTVFLESLLWANTSS